MEAALELLKAEAAQGVRKVCLTPHLRHRMFETPDEEIIQRFKQLSEEKKKAKIPVKLYLSREYHYDITLDKALESGTILPMARGVILTEFSYETPRAEMLSAVERLTRKGLRPLIAHVERYREVQSDQGMARELSCAGALLQVNAGSILAEEGRRQKKVAEKMLLSNLVFAVASDAHNLEERAPNLAECEAHISKYYGKEQARKLLYENPLKLLESKREEN